MRRLPLCVLLARIASAAWGVREALDRHRDRPWMEMIQDELRSHRVVVYSKTFCPHSRAVKEILRALSQGYVAVELDHVAHGRDLQRARARLTGDGKKYGNAPRVLFLLKKWPCDRGRRRNRVVGLRGVGFRSGARPGGPTWKS